MRFLFYAYSQINIYRFISGFSKWQQLPQIVESDKVGVQDGNISM